MLHQLIVKALLKAMVDDPSMQPEDIYEYMARVPQGLKVSKVFHVNRENFILNLKRELNE